MQASSQGFGANTPRQSQPESFADELRRNPGRLIAEVAEIRGLAPRAPIPINVDDDAAFVRAYEATTEERSKAEMEQLIGFFRTFNFSAETPTENNGPAAKESPLGALLDEQLLAFFDPKSRSVHVRQSKLMSSKKSPTEQRAIVAHEIEHALQHQSFGELPREQIDDDLRLAYKAVLEGDAMVVLVAEANTTWGLRRSLARMSQAVRNGLFSDRRDSPVLRSSPATVRDRLSFPYESGLAFEAEMYRSGGWPLIDTTFRKPPESTEQVLHPEKYLAGEHPIPVDTPDVPAGYTMMSKGKVGELTIHSVLGQCLSDDVASHAATGWGGDAYAVVKDDKGALSLLWSTVWDDEASAQRFAEAATSAAPCWGRRSQSGHHEKPVVTHEGTKVSIVHGFAESSTSSLSKALMAKVKAPLAPTMPAPGSKIIPITPHREIEKETAGQRGSFHPGLGLFAPPIAGGFPTLSNGLASFKGANHESYLIGVLDESATPKHMAQTFDDFARGLLKGLGSTGHSISVVDRSNIVLPIGAGASRVFSIDGTPVSIKVALLPVCNGNASIMLAVNWSTPDGRAQADRWLRSITIGSFPGGRAPLCEEIDP
ncbi:MAG: hypothetical protein U0165_06945 [Polyangiaceae bacterium]